MSNNWKKNLPQREEWDFRPAFTPPKGVDIRPYRFLEESEVMTCHSYEFAREDLAWREQVANWRQGTPSHTFGGYIDHWNNLWRKNAKVPHSEYYVLWPEWPDVPYLQIHPEERRNRLELWTGRSFRVAGKTINAAGKIEHKYEWEAPGLEIVNPHYLFANKDILIGKADWYEGPYENAILSDTISFLQSPHGGWRNREYITLQINFKESDEQLIERFRSTLKSRRQENGITPRRSQGSSSITRKLRDELRALGAWRLTRHYGLSAVQIEILTAEQSGQQFFSSEKSLKRAINRIICPTGRLFDIEYERNRQ